MKSIIFFANIIGLTLALFAQEETINLRITEVPYQPVYAFLRTSFDLGIQQNVDIHKSTYHARNQFGIALGLISCKESDIQFESRIGLRQVDLSNIDSIPTPKHYDLDIMIGGRYYPRYPTFAVSKTTPVRLTFSAVGGMGLKGQDLTNFGFAVAFSAGLAFSQKDNPSGILLEAQYRPLGTEVSPDVYLRPAWLISLAWLFGP